MLFPTNSAAPFDFTIINDTLPVPASMEVCFEVMLTDDSDLETTELIIFNLRSTPSEDRIMFVSPTSNVTILDDERKYRGHFFPYVC